MKYEKKDRKPPKVCLSTFIVFRIATGYFIQSLIYLSRPQTKNHLRDSSPKTHTAPKESFGQGISLGKDSL